MSWLSRVSTGMRITTGDGNVYKPKWKNASRAKEYNTSEFDFPDVPGTLVYRTTPRAYRYNLEFYFSGENHLEDATAFLISADDPRPWKISHPKYGSLTVHPLQIAQDDGDDNVSKFTVPCLETILDIKPVFSLDPVSAIISLKLKVNSTMSGSIVANVKKFSVANVNTMKRDINTFYTTGKLLKMLQEQAQAYFNAYHTASNLLNSALIAPLAAVNAMQDVLNYPATFSESVRNRVLMFVSQLEVLGATVSGLTSKSEKNLYEHNGGMLMSSMAHATVLNFNYNSRMEVLDVMDFLSQAYQDYLNNIDALQDDNESDDTKYVPTIDSQIQLAQLISYTISNLLNIAVNAKTERIIELNADSNVILLAHRFYGLKVDDSTIMDFINQNNIGGNELLQIPKGRRISYFVK